MHATIVHTWALALLLAFLAATPTRATPQEGWHATHPEWRSLHEVRSLEPESGVHQLLSLAAPLEHMVYGYLPYWEMAYQVPHWNLLEVLAWFAVGIDGEGLVTDYNGWGGEATQLLVEEAQANDTLVALTVTLFDNAAIGALLADPDSRAQAIATCLDLMAMHDVSGINIDFEFVPGSAKADFVVFMAELKAAVRALRPRGGQGHVTLAGPAVDWSGGYDYDQLLEVSDGIMVMGYGYHYGGGDPGPNAPLFGGGIWGPHSVAWTIDDYLAQGSAPFKERIFFGLPWYGRQWPVASTLVPGSALDSGKAVWFDVAIEEAAVYGAQYDEDSHSLFYHKEVDDQLWQVWYDDPAAFGEKLAYIKAQELGGIGLWALGYEGGIDAYWAEIATHLTSSPVNTELEEEEEERSISLDASSEGEGESDAVDVIRDDLGGPTRDDSVGPLLNSEDSDPSARILGRTQSMHVHETSPKGCQVGQKRPLGLLPLLLLSFVCLRRPRRARAS